MRLELWTCKKIHHNASYESKSMSRPCSNVYFVLLGFLKVLKPSAESFTSLFLWSRLCSWFDESYNKRMSLLFLILFFRHGVTGLSFLFEFLRYLITAKTVTFVECLSQIIPKLSISNRNENRLPISLRVLFLEVHGLWLCRCWLL